MIAASAGVRDLRQRRVLDLGRGVGEQDLRATAPRAAARPSPVRGRRAAACGDWTCARQTADEPIRRLMTAVSPVSSTSIARTGSATRMSSSAVTTAAADDVQSRPESIAAPLALDEAELGQRAQVAVDGRERRLEERAQLVGADLAAVGDGQEHAQAARERRVLGGFFGRAVEGRGHRVPPAVGGHVRYRSSPNTRRRASRSAILRVVRISAIRLQRLRVPLEPPFPAAWDPVPRTAFPVTIVRVETDEGVVGIGSGDTMDGFEAFEHLFVGQDPLAIARHVRVLETIDFHAGRYWPLEAALWDIAGQVAGLPVATLFGGASDGIPAYASCGMLLPAAERAESALRLREEGFRALKIRVDPRRLDEGLAAVTATRAAVGDSMAIMVDLNQGWRMAGDMTPSIDVGRAREIAARLAEYDVLWVEEPLAGTDLRGLARCAPSARASHRRRRDDPDLHEALAALDADAFDVYQPDVVLAGGMLRTRTLAELALARGRWFTPHTWTNGLGLLANLHVAAGVGGGPFIEFPYDPPGWTPERRDAFLAEPIRRTPRASCTSRRRRGSASSSTRPPSRGTPHDRDRAHRPPTGSSARRVEPRNEAFIDGRFVPAASGGPSTTSPAGTGASSRGRGGRRRGRRPGGRRRRARSTTGAGRTMLAGRPQDRPAQARRVDPGEPRRAGPARVARRRQADPRHAGGRRPVRGQDHPVVRRDHRQGLRRGRADRAGRLSLVTREPIGVVAPRSCRGTTRSSSPRGSSGRRWRPATRSC